jgi:hypothetical protein
MDANYRGYVAYVYAYDIAYDMVDQAIATVQGQPVRQYQAPPTKRRPRDLFFHNPQVARLPDVQHPGPQGPVQITRSVKVFPVGALSLTFCVPFAVQDLTQLNDYHEPRFDGRPLREDVRALANELLKELRPALVRPVDEVADDEAYTVFFLHRDCLHQGAKTLSAEQWLQEHRAKVAALLTEEEVERLSQQEVADTVRGHLSYYTDDLVVADWDAALVIDRPEEMDETLHVIEVANVQLAELQAYDRTLDTALSRSYIDLARRPRAKAPKVMWDLREIGLDLSRLTDELSNTAKFLGDWHLARVYQNLSRLFHLDAWRRTIDEKLATLRDVYRLLREDQINRWMITLELTIIVLFVLDLILLLLPHF